MRKLNDGVLLLAIVVVVALAWYPFHAHAQGGVTVTVGQAFDVVYTHDGVNTQTYHLAITGPVGYTADLPVSALTAGRVTFPVATGLSSAGSYTIVVTATGPGGSTASDPFGLGVSVAAPSKGTVTIVKH